MNPQTKLLIDQVRGTYQARQPELLELFDEEAIDILGLTGPEVKVLAACILASEEGVTQAQMIAQLSDRAFGMSLSSLQQRDLLTVDGNRIDFSNAARQLRLQMPQEVAEVEGEPPSIKMVLRPLREQVIFLVRQGDTPAAGLGRVFHFVFGRKPSGKDYGILGLIAKELGREQAATFLLEHATDQSQTLLHDLVALARARAKGFRPINAPDERQQNLVDAILHQRSRELAKRLGLD